MKNVLTIAGSDSSGGAGIQADIKTMGTLGVHGMSVITVITAQNSLGVQKSFPLTPEIIGEQLESLFSDIEIDGVKIGMVSDIEIIKIIREKLLKYSAKNIVIDTVMVSKNGYHLLKPEAIEELKSLISISTLVTPNIPEAEILSDMKIKTQEDVKKACIEIAKLGVKAVLIKGGHSDENSCTDTLYFEKSFYYYTTPRLENKNTHGTGCTLSSAITTFLAKEKSIPISVELGKKYITKAIENSFDLGHGIGPLGHFVEIYKRLGIKYW